MKIAILALQGAFLEHQQILERLGIESVLIRNLDDWNEYLSILSSPIYSCKCSGALIIPGGESTAMTRIMNDEQLTQPLAEAISSGMPVFGTCAGMILLAKHIDNNGVISASPLDMKEGVADIMVKRNAYGRQLGSFYTEKDFKGIGNVPMTFIRAPYITSVGKGVEILAEVNGNIVAARQNKILVTSFHPELNDDTRIHEYFISMCS